MFENEETFFGSANDREQLFAGASDLAVSFFYMNRKNYKNHHVLLIFTQVTSMDQRSRVMQETDKLRHTTDVIKNALRTVRKNELFF